MQFSSGFVLAALAAVAQAIQFDFDSTDFAPVAGEPMVLSWSDADGPVTITLLNGAYDDLDEFRVIATGQASGSGSYTWTPPTDIPTDTYALSVSDDSDINYTPQFSYVCQDVDDSTSTTETTTETTTDTSSTSATATTYADMADGWGKNATMTTATESSETSDSDSATETETDDDTETETEEDAASTTVANANGSPRLVSSLTLIVGSVVAFALFN